MSWRRCFQAFDLQIDVQTDTPALGAELDHLTSTFSPLTHGRRLEYRLCGGARPALVRDGRVLCFVEEAADLLPVFEFELYSQALAGLDAALLPLHAATLLGARGALVLCGASGSGKSTLALALVARGATYLGDEFAVVDERQRVRGMPRPLSFELTSSARPAIPPPCVTSVHTVPGRDGRPRSTLLVHPPARQLCHSEVALQLVVMLERRSAPRPSLQRLSDGEALCALWQHGLAPRGSQLPIAAALCSKVPAYRIGGGTPDELCSALAGLWELRRDPDQESQDL